MLVLHDYFRSGAAHRVRIALHLKGLAFHPIPHHLRKGEQRAPEYLALNPQGLVPTLVDGAVTVTQSLAIMEYLDEAYPDTARLLPGDPAGRARVRALSAIVAADTHPLNNLRVLTYLERDLGLDEDRRNAWCRRWLGESFAALEALLSGPGSGTFCHGDTPGMADACLVPQMLSAKRFGCDVSAYPTVARIAAAAQALQAFQRADPMAQPDAE